MKKNIRLLVLAVSIIVIGVIAYLKFLNVTYVDRTVRKYTRIKDYSIEEKLHDDHQWYAKMLVNVKDGESLFRLYPFKYGYNTKVIAGKSQNNYIKDCTDCWYYLDDKKQGVYGYTLYCLSGDKKQLEIYQEFGD